MDWNRDGKVDGHDMVHFHEVINSDNTTFSTVNSTSGRASSDSNSHLGWLGKFFIVLLVLEFLSFLGEHM